MFLLRRSLLFGLQCLERSFVLAFRSLMLWTNLINKLRKYLELGTLYIVRRYEGPPSSCQLHLIVRMHLQHHKSVPLWLLEHNLWNQSISFQQSMINKEHTSPQLDDHFLQSRHGNVANLLRNPLSNSCNSEASMEKKYLNYRHRCFWIATIWQRVAKEVGHISMPTLQKMVI
jgi:hypothetical protein